jgi:hypothetical protein
MTDTNIPDVTLASADPTLLSCWEEKVRQGVECSLLLKHSKGKIFTILKTSVLRSPEAEASAPKPSLAKKVKETVKEKKKKKKRNTTKRLESLLSFHQRLVDEKGMPPSRLMLEHAAPAPDLPSSPPQITELEKSSDQFKCDLCDYTNPTQRGLNSHKGHKHKEQQKPVALSDELENQISFNCDKCKYDLGCEDSLKRHMEEKHRIFKCDFCDYADQNKHSIRLHTSIQHTGIQISDLRLF